MRENIVFLARPLYGGFAWPYMALHGPTRLYMALHGQDPPYSPLSALYYSDKVLACVIAGPGSPEGPPRSCQSTIQESRGETKKHCDQEFYQFWKNRQIPRSWSPLILFPAYDLEGANMEGTRFMETREMSCSLLCPTPALQSNGPLRKQDCDWLMFLGYYGNICHHCPTP